MTEITVSEQIIEVLDYLGEKFGIVVDWNANNVVPIVQDLCGKYINWEIATSVVTFIICVITLIVSIKLFQRGCKALEGKDEIFDSSDSVLFFFVSVPYFVLALGFGIYEIFDVIKCITFPELKIYEYITQFITNLN